MNSTKLDNAPSVPSASYGIPIGLNSLPDIKDIQAMSQIIEGGLAGADISDIESKAEKFIRIADRRTNKVCKEFDLLGNLSNKGSYDYTTEQVEKIFNRIVIHFESARDRLMGIKHEPKPFSLRD